MNLETDFILEGFPQTVESCRHHINFNASRVQVDIHNLRIKMSGKFEFIYDALLVPLASLLKQMLNTEL